LLQRQEVDLSVASTTPNYLTAQNAQLISDILANDALTTVPEIWRTSGLIVRDLQTSTHRVITPCARRAIVLEMYEGNYLGILLKTLVICNP
jgi:hypothetical protein